MVRHNAIAGALATLLAGASAAAEEVPRPTVSWERAFPARIEATFQYQKGKTPLAISRWIGTVDVAMASGPGQSSKAELRVGLGRSRGFSSQWLAIGKNNELATGATESVPLYLTAPDVSGEELDAWRSVRSTSNPALVIPLVPRVGELGYTNAEAIRGRIFLWDESGKRPEYARYADFTVPSNGFALKMTPELGGEAAIQFLITNIQLGNLSQRLWRRFLADGNSHVSIPTIAGASRGWIYGDSSPQLLNVRRPARHLDTLYRSLESIHAEGILPVALVRQLVEKLDVIAEPPDRSQLIRASTQIFDFERIVRTLAQEKALVSADADFLLQQSEAFLSATTAMGSPGFSVGSQVDYTPSTPEERTQFHVDAHSSCTPATGSVECPFPSIAAALDEAAVAGHVGVELNVASGLYRDPLFITRDTVIRSLEPSELAVLIAATTTNHTPAYLKIEGVTLITFGPDGAVNVSNDDAITVLTDVTILAPQRFGVAQSGGELWLTNVEISGTTAAPGFPWHGTGLTITNGTVAVLSHVEIENSQSGGILADGEGTYLWGVDLELRRNGMNPFNLPDSSVIPPFVGALNVRGGAVADLRGLRATRNELVGVLVQGGGQAIVSNAVIESTLLLALPSGNFGGIGVAAKADGSLELWDFGSYDNDLLGVGVYPGGTVALHDGEVMRNPIGAKIWPHDPPYDAELLRDNVRWDNDVSDIECAGIYVPDAESPLSP